MTVYLWGFVEWTRASAQHNRTAPDQVSGGNGNKAALSGSLRADPNSAELRRLFWKIFPIQLRVAIQPDS